MADIKVGDWIQDSDGLQGEVTDLQGQQEGTVRVLIERLNCDNRYPEDRRPENLEVLERDEFSSP